MFDVRAIREQFPALTQRIHGRPLVYLDTAATALKPARVIEAVRRAHAVDSANIHRGVHTLSQRATEAYEGAREKVRRFLRAADTREIVFVRGTTEAINLVAHAFGRANVRAGDQVLITALEHHSNIVPWQMLCQETGAELRVVPVTDEGEVTLEDFERNLTRRTRLVAVAHASNALGTVLPVEPMIRMAHERGVRVLVDGAQAAPHLLADVARLGCDFYALSGHKLYGPTGVGVLYGRLDLLEGMPPYQGGGDMIRSVTFAKTRYADPPQRFEAGTPNIAGVIGLGAAIDFLSELDRGAVLAHEADLLAHGTELLSSIPGLRLLGTANEKIGVLSFTLRGVHPHDLGTILDREGIAIRTGHHCAEPLMERLGVPATARASLGVYSERADLAALACAVDKARHLMGAARV
jgi:cysteine desulfurase/selenocysteine lyase